MIDYVATFHTHLGALMTFKALGQAGVKAQMAPVPRKLSSSCGTCVFYSAAEAHLDLMSEEVEAVYKTLGSDYKKILTNE